jgi:hypothetical protein
VAAYYSISRTDHPALTADDYDIIYSGNVGDRARSEIVVSLFQNRAILSGMAYITFDTYERIEQLKKAGIPEPHAKAIIDSLKFSQSDVATTHDLKLLEQALKQDMALLEQAVKQDIALLEQRMETFATKVELAALKSDIIRWLIGLFFAQAGLVFALLKFVR